MTREWFPYHTPAERPTWIQGDLHFENFGAFRNEQGALVYDVNDFDEGYLGSYLYDLLRMSVSIALVCRMKGESEDAEQHQIEAYLRAYAKQMWKFVKGKDDPASFIMDEERASGKVRKLLRKLRKRKEQHFWKRLRRLYRSIASLRIRMRSSPRRKRARCASRGLAAIYRKPAC